MPRPVRSIVLALALASCTQPAPPERPSPTPRPRRTPHTGSANAPATSQPSASPAAAPRAPAPAPASKPKPKAKPKPRPVSARVVARSWYRKAYLQTDRRYLARAFRRAKFELPKGAYLMAARVLRGIKQPAFQYYSIDDTAFTYSAGHYWPASTIKLMAVVGALHTLRAHGAGVGATVELDIPVDGHHKGPLTSIIERALRLSTNPDYNRLMYIAGFSTMNDVILSEANGAPYTVLQRRYGGKKVPGANLRSSPEIKVWYRGKESVIAARPEVKTEYPQCPKEGNCTSLFELSEFIRRVTLHDELPKTQRFDLSRRARKVIMAALEKSHKKLVPGASEALGNPAVIYNKAGRYPGDDHLDAALVVDTVKKSRRFLIALSVPYSYQREPGKVTLAQLNAMGAATIKALLRRGRGGPTLQLDAGVPIEVTLEHKPPEDNPRALTFEIRIRAKSKRVRIIDAWLDRSPLRERRRRRRRTRRGRRRAKRRAKRNELVIVRTFKRPGDHVIVVHARRGWRRLGYRAAVIVVDDGVSTLAPAGPGAPPVPPPDLPEKPVNKPPT
ncbi:MAG: hypothetical protein KC503_37440 [Myxococcales bacterium]|nr:hypothetical protein [Myxococcales bacterium]